MATEGGIWYLTRQNAQNAADAGAIAGALASYSGGGSDAATLVQQNGFSSATVTPTAMPAVRTTFNPSPYYAAFSTTQVEAQVSEDIAPLLSALFGQGTVTVGGDAYAMVEPVGNACVLALTGSVTISSGRTTVSSCSVASNDGVDDPGINVIGSLNATGAQTITSCCGAGGLILTRGAAAVYHPPTRYLPANDPSTALASVPACTAGSNIPTPDAFGVINLQPYETTHTAYCNGDLPVGSGQTMNVPTGTYFFNNASLTISGTATVTCTIPCTGGSNGTSFVFTGTPPGSYALMISNTATVKLSAYPAVTPATSFPGLVGVVFYGTGTTNVQLALNSTAGVQTINGGIYFPNASLSYAGNTATGSTCIILVAGSVTFTAAAKITGTINGCSRYGTALPVLVGVHLVSPPS